MDFRSCPVIADVITLTQTFTEWLYLLERLKPISQSVFVSLSVVVWCWFSMSGMDYTPDSPFCGYQTAGWFFLGLPLLLVFAIFCAAIASFIHRYSPFASKLAIGLFLILISTTVYWSLPSNRLASILNLPTGAIEIFQLRQTDSFNDGLTTVAMFSGDADLFDQICEVNELHAADETYPFWLNWLQPHDQDEATPVAPFDSPKLTCYHDTVENVIYAYHRSRIHPNE